jgi:hypothetical protein
VLLAACSGGSSTFQNSSTLRQDSAAMRSLHRDAVHPELVTRPGVTAKLVHGLPQVHFSAAFPGGGVVWVTDAGTNNVYLCTPTGCTAKGTGWNTPQGIAADSHYNVYVADTGNSRIVELSPNGNTTLAIYNDPGEYPASVNVARNGLLGVTNLCSAPSCGQGNVVFYAPGNTTGPTSTASALLYRIYDGAFDKSCNFYFDGFATSYYSDVEVGVVPHACAGGTKASNTGIGDVSFPGGVKVGMTNGLLNVDDQTGLIVHQYSLPSYTEGASIPLGGAGDPIGISLVNGDTCLWTADAGVLEANEYLDPQGGSPLYTISGFSLPIGVAATQFNQNYESCPPPPVEIINQFNRVPAGPTPTNFEIVLKGNLVQALCGPTNPPCLDQPVYGQFNPFCPPSQGPNNPCYPTVTYNSANNTTTVTYSGPGLYQNIPNKPGLYHFGIFATPYTGTGSLKPLSITSYWSYSGQSRIGGQSSVAQPSISINPPPPQGGSSSWAYAEVFVAAALTPSGPAAYGTWNYVPYNPQGSAQPKLTFTNWGSQPLYVVSSGIVPGLSVPTDPACFTNPSCPENMSILGILNFAGSPPPGESGSPFVPLTYPPPNVLAPAPVQGKL